VKIVKMSRIYSKAAEASTGFKPGNIGPVERRTTVFDPSRDTMEKLLANYDTVGKEDFDITKIRYHKIVIMTDADVDGSHIRTLLLTFFYRQMPEVIERGYLYIAQPPLYKISKGKEVHYAYTDEEKFKIIGADVSLLEAVEVNEGEEAELEEEEAPKAKGKGKDKADDKKATGKWKLQRYKGLGEMNPEELWETTMDPKNRILKQVNILDAELADRVFDMLMGTDVPARKSFIQTNAKYANLDV
jgi:DNA gyrase subunit B